MTLAKVDFTTFTSWTLKEREEYANAWMYIHKNGKKEKNRGCRKLQS